MECSRGSMSTNNRPWCDLECPGGFKRIYYVVQVAFGCSLRLWVVLARSRIVRRGWDSKSGSWRVQEVPGWFMRVQVDQENLK